MADNKNKSSQTRAERIIDSFSGIGNLNPRNNIDKSLDGIGNLRPEIPQTQNQQDQSQSQGDNDSSDSSDNEQPK